MGAERAKKSWLAAVIAPVLPFAVMAVYVLSVGPALYLANNGCPWIIPALEVFYAPLVWIGHHWAAFGEALRRYGEWWIS